MNRTLRSAFACAAVALSAAWSAPTLAGQGVPPASIAETERHRLFVLSDVEADPDDTQSLIRLLLYSNEIDLEGLVATTSVWKRSAPRPESIAAVVRAYGEVLPNLRRHDERYPAAAELVTLVSAGQPGYGMQSVGQGKDSPGALALIGALEKEDPRPLWVNAWGGVNTLAQALYVLRSTRPAGEVARMVAKLRVYTISDQDDAGPWLRKTFPGLFYIVTPEGNYARATWNGINAVIDGIDNSTIGNRWLAENIQQDHGPLGAAYPDVAWGLEGDTPAFLGLIPNGLSVPERPDWGGWGGRYELYTPPPLADDPVNAVAGVVFDPETRAIWSNAEDAYGPPQRAEFGRATRKGKVVETSARASLWRWRDAFQHDFAARMDWTVKPPASANHPPVVATTQPTRLTVKAGEGLGLSARGSSDPDGDSLSYYWFHYPEAGSYRGSLDLGAENSDGVWITAPQVDREMTIHVVVAVTDKGDPPLTRYARFIVTVSP